MPEKKGFGFSYDERTDVPTFEEVSSVMTNKKGKKTTQKKSNSKRNSNNKAKKTNKVKKSKPMSEEAKRNIKRLAVSLVAILVLIALFGAGGFFTYKYRDKIAGTGGLMTGKVTGFFAVSSDEENSAPKFEFTVKELEIDLKEQEEKLVLHLNSDCENEKGIVALDIRGQKDNECDKKIDPVQDNLDECELDYEAIKENYDDCKDDLDTCEDSE